MIHEISEQVSRFQDGRTRLYGKHAVVEIFGESGIARKRFYPPAALTSQIADAYIMHHDEIGTVYPVPDLQSVLSRSGYMETVESYIPGYDLSQVIESGDVVKTAAAIQAVIAPLSKQILPGIQLKGNCYSPVPLGIMYDLTPGNFRISPEGELFAIDFYPPRLRGVDGLIYPVDQSLDPATPDRLSLIYGDAATMVSRLIYLIGKINPERSLLNAKTAIEAALMTFPASIRSALAKNSHDPRVEGDLLQIEAGLSILQYLRSLA